MELQNWDIVEPRYFNGKFIGEPLDAWGEVHFRARGKKRKWDTYSFLPNVPVITKSAATSLYELLLDNAESLPASIDGKEAIILNVTTLIGCLDHSKSEIRRFPSGSIMNIEKFALRVGPLTNAVIFKIPEVSGKYVFVTDVFKEAVEANGLTGFDFHEVWDSDEVAVAQRKVRYQAVLEEIERLKGPNFTFS